MNPKVSVVMPVYNGEKYLAQAVRSILDQTFKDFELIVINDGSTDNTAGVIKGLLADPRVRLIDNGTNLGLSKSFNRGIEAARGTYIARMDADDMSAPKRLERQVQFLDKRPHVDVVGSNMIMIDEKGQSRGLHRRQIDHIGIKFSSLFSTPMMHPTVMGRAAVFKTHPYNETMTNSEDYELWSRLLFETGTNFANIHEPLLLYRTYPHSFTQTLNLDKRIVSAHNSIRNMGHYLKLSEKEKNLIADLRKERDLSLFRLARLFVLYIRLARAFSRKEKLGFKASLRIFLQLPPKAFFLAKYWVKRRIR
ncbi:glycosyltransferase [Candidatus Parcubacteria bacterium]|nr:glycosyltransferase [Candidatus Parcubacteria bacterium]